MNCPVCNNPLPEYAQFCTNCGTSLAQLPPQPQQPVYPYPPAPVAPPAPVQMEVPIPVEPPAPIQMEPPAPVKEPKTIAEEKEEKNSGKAGLTVMLVIFAVLLIGSLVVNYLLMQKAQKIEREYNKMEDVSEELSETERKLRRTENELLALEQETGEALIFLEFYEENAAVVGESGNLYHRYGCQYLDINSFSIYSVDLAEFMGHTRCPHCHD